MKLFTYIVRVLEKGCLLRALQDLGYRLSIASSLAAENKIRGNAVGKSKQALVGTSLINYAENHGKAYCKKAGYWVYVKWQRQNCVQDRVLIINYNKVFLTPFTRLGQCFNDVVTGSRTLCLTEIIRHLKLIKQIIRYLYLCPI